MTDKILVLGCGALGSQIALGLALGDREFFLVDDDRVGDENIATSAYYPHSVGMLKVNALAELLVRKAGVQVNAHSMRLTEQNIHVWRYFSGLVIDTFDNVEARKLTVGLTGLVLHAGVGLHGTGEITWDEWYQLPTGVEVGPPPCTHLLGRQIIRFTSTCTVGVIEDFDRTGVKRNLYVTADMKVISI